MDLVDPRKGVLGRKSPYPAEFRNDAVALYRSAGGKRTYAAVAADVGVSGETLRSWAPGRRARRPGSRPRGPDRAGPG
ncbi:transposase [Streptomyces sp. NPDC058357]|uniref:transposase n=1 Tax=unclassified Streptomyces TaxID=2593676 RepID=UPI00364FE136